MLNSNCMEQEAALNSLSTLMSIIPGDTYGQFAKHFIDLPDHAAHDTLSESDIQIFRTPEGTLSVEQGVYVAESVAPKNLKQAKGRFRVYDKDETPDRVSSNNLAVSSNQSIRRDVAVAGKKDAPKSMKKPEKTKTAKEEARELQLNEEGRIREKVMSIQHNLSLMLKALGEMAIANPIFTHSQLPSLVKFVSPLLRSPIVGDAAFESLVKLSKCTIEPLCNWSLEIATALRLTATEETSVLWDLFPSIGEGEQDGTPSLGLFERLVSGLTISCKSGPLPVDSFTFIFPVIERILLSPKKTGLHDDVLQIIFLHMDPILPLPRIRMLSVLYHVLGVVPAYQTSICPALNELCLGLQPDEVAPALSGVYAKDIHVRMACLNAVKCIPAVSNCSIPQNVEIATSIWLALHEVSCRSC